MLKECEIACNVLAWSEVHSNIASSYLEYIDSMQCVQYIQAN
jgi:hypothetical protein